MNRATGSTDTIASYVTRVVREEVRELSPYTVADAGGMVNLDAMENPYPLPPALRAEIGELAAGAALNRYPDPGCRALKATLRRYLQVPDELDIVVGNGSDEIIQMLALAVARPGASMLGLEPSFAMFPLIARVCGLRFVGVPLSSDFELDVEAALTALRAERPALGFIAYPNNPTGNLFDAAAVEAIVRAAPGLVVVDEAYQPFAQASFLPRLREFPNLLVMRTLSKLGLAGLRLGVLIGRREWLAQVEKLRLPYNVGVLSQAVAVQVLRHADVLEAQAAEIRAERERLAEALQRVAGVRVFPSRANFLLYRVPRASAIHEMLQSRGVLVKKLAGSHPALADCLRVTVGTLAENDAFLAAMHAAVAARSAHA